MKYYLIRIRNARLRIIEKKMKGAVNHERSYRGNIVYLIAEREEENISVMERVTWKRRRSEVAEKEGSQCWTYSLG